jgi:hypothetical protein
MAEDEGNNGVQKFLKILKLHSEYPAQTVEQAVTLALEYGCVHADGVRLCIHQLLNPETPVSPLDLTEHPRLAEVGRQSVDLSCYQQLLQVQ